MMPCDVYLIDELQKKKESGIIQKKTRSTKRVLSVQKNNGCAQQRVHTPTQGEFEGGQKNI